MQDYTKAHVVLPYQKKQRRETKRICGKIAIWVSGWIVGTMLAFAFFIPWRGAFSLIFNLMAIVCMVLIILYRDVVRKKCAS
jgi:hypothetical protein